MDYSILVNTCDNYEKIWPIFFSMFHRFWPEYKDKIYLNTETKTYFCDELEIIPCNCKESDRSRTWSSRLYHALDHIDTDLVLMILDDFIFEKKVNDLEFQKTVKWMKKKPEIGMLQFNVGSDCGKLCSENPRWREQNKKEEYRINCQIALWRKDYLLKILRKFETPWEFERYGSIRSRRYKERVFAWATDSNYIFTYNWGKPIIGGKWNLDEIDRLEAKLNIKFDLSGREGMRNYYENLKMKPKPKRNFYWVWKKIKHIRSLI